MSARHEFGGERERAGYDRAQPHPGEKADHGELGHRIDPGGDEGEKRDHHHSANDHGLAPDPVGKRTGGEDSKEAAQSAIGEGRAERAGIEQHRTRDRRRGVLEGLAVQPVHEHGERAQADNLELDSSDAAAGENRRDVDLEGRFSHRLASARFHRIAPSAKRVRARAPIMPYSCDRVKRRTARNVCTVVDGPAGRRGAFIRRDGGRKTRG